MASNLLATFHFLIYMLHLPLTYNGAIQTRVGPKQYYIA